MSKKIEQIQHKNYIDSDTGEVKEVIEITKEVGRNNFYIAYMNTLVDVLELIGGKQTKVLQYILNNMDSNNLLIKSQEEIATESGVSLSTVKRTINILKTKPEGSPIITTKPNIIMVNPKFLNKGNLQHEQMVMIRFKEIQSK